MTQDDGQLQFDDVERLGTAPDATTCAACSQAVQDSYYQANGQVACPACRDALVARTSGGSRIARFTKAVVLGLLGAVVGWGIYFGVLKLTGYEVGLIAIVVGLLVGGGVRLGGEGRGGWLYQAMAIGLTYCTIVATYAPLIAAEIEADGEAVAVAGEQASAVAAGEAAGGTEDASPAEVPWLIRHAAYFVLAFVMPVAAGFENIVGMIIIAIALWEAWRINKRPRLDIQGPFHLAPPPLPSDG
jgi:hypothetical protein